MHAQPSTAEDSSSNTTQPVSGSATLPLIALAIGAFGIGTTEFGPMGMLPKIAEGVGVSVPSAGMLVSAYAIGVTIGAPFMTLLLARWPKRKALMALMAIFVMGNLLSAVAPGYASLMVARVITSLTHGAFFGIGSVVAASLVPREKQSSALSMMFLGLTFANIGGVPVATWVSQTIGWRESFAAISALGLIAMLSLRAFLPVGSKGAAPKVKAELKVLTKPIVVQGISVTVLSSAAMFTLYTYVNPALQTFTHASPTFIAGTLALVGVGFSIGNSIGGKLADRSIRNTIVGFLLLEAVSMIAFPWLAHTQIGAALGLLVWGTAAFALVPPIQMQVMRAATEAPGLASSMNIAAFNLGNAIGAAAGAIVLNMNLGYAAVMYAGAALALLSLTIVFWSSVKKPVAIEQNAADRRANSC